MSKKDRLKAQKEKQIIRQKKLEEQEKLSAEKAKEKHSQAAQKLIKKSKRERTGKEPAVCLILKLLMIIPFGYSAFFYGGVTVTGILLKYIEPVPPNWVAYAIAAGAVLIGTGIVFSFFKKYIISFVLIGPGTFSFLKGGNYLIDKIQYKLNNFAVDEEFTHMDTEYMRYYYPILAVTVIAFMLMIISVIRKIREKKRLQHDKDTAPVKSIID